MASIVLLHIIGSVCLLLFGLRLVRNGVTRAFGVQLRKIIGLSTSNRLTAFVAGIGVAALLQSSMATTMIISSFAGQGLIGTAAALAVVLGADVGTTFIAQVMSFDMSWLSPVLIIAGYFFYAGDNQTGTLRQVGRILVGLGLMMLALALIRTASIPLKESDTLPLILAPLNSDPVLAVAVGVLLTWLAHSSLAIVLSAGFARAWRRHSCASLPDDGAWCKHWHRDCAFDFSIERHACSSSHSVRQFNHAPDQRTASYCLSSRSCRII